MNDFGAGMFIGAVVTSLFACVLIVFGGITKDDYWRERMIEEGNATWAIDPVTGHAWFKTFPRKGGTDE